MVTVCSAPTHGSVNLPICWQQPLQHCETKSRPRGDCRAALIAKWVVRSFLAWVECVCKTTMPGQSLSMRGVLSANLFAPSCPIFPLGELCLTPWQAHQAPKLYADCGSVSHKASACTRWSPSTPLYPGQRCTIPASSCPLPASACPVSATPSPVVSAPVAAADKITLKTASQTG